MSFQINDRVKHTKRPEWGVGKVLNCSAAGCEFFFTRHGKSVINPRYFHLLEKLSDSEGKDPLLDNLRFDETDPRKFHPIGDMIEKFRKEYPEGFYDAKYLADERDYKLKAHEFFKLSLCAGPFSSFIKNNELDQVLSLALKAVNSTNLIFVNEKIALNDGLKKKPIREEFACVLYEYLHGKNSLQQRFEQFANFLFKINAAKWTTQTYFLFLMFPDKYMFMKPSVTQAAADAFAFELNYRPEINWRSYESLLTFSEYLFKILSSTNEKLVPRDMIDVQSFIWVAIKYA